MSKIDYEYIKNLYLIERKTVFEMSKILNRHRTSVQDILKLVNQYILLRKNNVTFKNYKKIL